MTCTFLVLIFAGTYFRGDGNDRISSYMFSWILHRNAAKIPKFPISKNFQNNISAGTNFRELCQKPRNPPKLIPIRYLNKEMKQSDPLF